MIWNHQCSGFNVIFGRRLVGNRLVESSSILSTVAMGAKAKKKSGSRKQRASSTRGFGAPPLTLEEVCESFKNRRPDLSKDEEEGVKEKVACPCGTGKSYEDCCLPYHMGEMFPQKPKDVLRTRYTAFVYRLPSYIIKTTHETCRDYREDMIGWAKDLDKNGMFDSFDFLRLEAGEEKPGADGNEAYVEFRVYMKAKEAYAMHSEGDEVVIRELSRFLRDGQGWKYASGDVTMDATGIDDVVLNT